MRLQNRLADTGNWLFRWRSYLPLAFVCVMMLALWGQRETGNVKHTAWGWQFICFGLSWFGLGIRALTVGHTPRGTSGRETRKQRAKALNTTGAYSVVRNPLYLGNFFIGLGIVAFIPVWWLILLYLLSFCVCYERIIMAEEAYLHEEFGAAYLAWAAGTPVFIPAPGLYQKAVLPFSLRNVLKREYNAFLVIIVSFFTLHTFGAYAAGGRIKADTGWNILLAVGITAWLVLRSLKKYTRLLKVEGR